MIYNVCVTKTKLFRTVLYDTLDIRNFFSLSDGGESLHRLPRKAVGVPLLEVFKTSLDKYLSNQI